MQWRFVTKLHDSVKRNVTYNRLYILTTQLTQCVEVGFEILVAVSTKMAVFWVVVPCSLVVSNRFHARGLLIALMMEAAMTSETLVNFYQTTRRYNPEDSHLRTQCVVSSSVAHSSSAGPCSLWNPIVHNSIHKSPSLDSTNLHQSILSYIQIRSI
jgi:hypothetical protein